VIGHLFSLGKGSTVDLVKSKKNLAGDCNPWAAWVSKMVLDS
jgi:hypothetical protein